VAALPEFITLLAGEFGCSAALDEATAARAITYVALHPWDPNSCDLESDHLAEEFRSPGEIRYELWRSRNLSIQNTDVRAR